MNTSLYGLDKTNVLFITLDCCRYDTLLQAKAPFLKSIGLLEKAKTHGTYTLPAHMSFFMGYLPIATISHAPYYSPDVRQLWRLHSGRTRELSTVGVMLNGFNMLEGYRQLGYRIIGAGGVRWFQNKTLTGLFDKFLFFGPDDTESVFKERVHNDFALNHIPKLLKEIPKKGNYFLFLNCLETHVPYDFGEGIYSQKARKIIQKAMPIWGCKKINLDKVDITQEELVYLHKAQIKALEAIDSKIKKLVESLPGPLLLVVSGDHGECFGEGMNWGHGSPYSKVMEVPLIISVLS